MHKAHKCVECQHEITFEGTGRVLGILQLQVCCVPQQSVNNREIRCWSSSSGVASQQCAYVCRDPQASVISNALAGNDSLVVMATGGGKSICYQVPPLVSGTAFSGYPNSAAKSSL